MLRAHKQVCSLLAAAALAPSVWGFSLLGPYATPWQVPQLGYNLPGDIGGPMFLHSFYRWNVTNITYAFDQSFINYFGTNGMKAVDEAVAIINALPPASQIDINQYPLDTRLWNAVAAQAGLMDLKSVALSMLLEQLGLANPERYAWTVYHRAAAANNTNWYVIQMNYDPDTYLPTGRVNGIYYTYRIEPFTSSAGDGEEAFEYPVTLNDRLPFSSVAGREIPPGYFYTGLTRDDVAGLKFLYSTNTLAVEDLLPTVTQGSNTTVLPGAWVPYQGTTNVLTNTFLTTNLLAGLTNASNFVRIGIRGGVNKPRFQRVQYDSLLGNTFTPVTNRYYDYVIITNKVVRQEVQRAITAPDIVFLADHLGLVDVVVGGTVTSEPALVARTDTAAWINNDALNGLTTEWGPGVISPPGGGGAGTNAATGSIALTFTSDLGGYLNQNPGYMSEQWTYASFWRWASYDQTTNMPILYPGGGPLTLDQLLALINLFSQTNSTSTTGTP